jgi:DNA-binding protein H-NS
MRKPRDYDSELKALDDKAKQLRGARLTQLGTLVISTSADALSIEELAGALLSAVDTKDAEIRGKWRHRGAAFFQTSGRGSAGKANRIASRGTAQDPVLGDVPVIGDLGEVGVAYDDEQIVIGLIAVLRLVDPVVAGIARARAGTPGAQVYGTCLALFGWIERAPRPTVLPVRG